MAALISCSEKCISARGGIQAEFLRDARLNQRTLSAASSRPFVPCQTVTFQGRYQQATPDAPGGPARSAARRESDIRRVDSQAFFSNNQGTESFTEHLFWSVENQKGGRHREYGCPQLVRNARQDGEQCLLSVSLYHWYFDIPAMSHRPRRANRQPTLHCECPKATSRPPTLEVANQDAALYGASQIRSHKDQLLSPRCGSEVVAPDGDCPQQANQAFLWRSPANAPSYGACVDAQAYRSTHVLTLL